MERMVPIRRDENIQGILIFSRRFPMSRVRRNAAARNRNIVTIFVMRRGGYLTVLRRCWFLGVKMRGLI